MPMTYAEDPQSGMPVPEESIVVFADLLGFGERVTSAFSKGEGPLLLRDVRDAVGHASAAFNIGYLTERIVVWLVSDSVIVGVPLRHSRRVHALSQDRPAEIRFSSEADATALVLALGRFQRRLIRRSFLVRGAVTVGPHFMGGTLAAGPALVEAVRMEGEKTECARMPRVNLHASFVRALNGVGFIPEYESGAWLSSNLIGIGCDQKGDPLVGEGCRSYFIDYLALACLRWHDDDRWPKLRSFLANHRAMIEEGLKHPREDVRRKYEWLRVYHDQCCQHPSVMRRESLHVR